LVGVLVGNVLSLRFDEAPNLVTLDALAGQVAKGLVLIVAADFAQFDQQFRVTVFFDGSCGTWARILFRDFVLDFFVRRLCYDLRSRLVCISWTLLTWAVRHDPSLQAGIMQLTGGGRRGRRAIQTGC
jgi:hypothetical protein